MDDIAKLLPFKRMDNTELLTEAVLFGYISGSEVAKEALPLISGVKVAMELYCRFTETDRLVDGLRAVATQSIADYVKSHPRASDDELTREIKRTIDDFAVKVALVTGHLGK